MFELFFGVLVVAEDGSVQLRFLFKDVVRVLDMIDEIKYLGTSLIQSLVVEL